MQTAVRTHKGWWKRRWVKVMNFVTYIRALIQTKGWIEKESVLWSASHYTDEHRDIARRVSAVVVSQLGVSFSMLTPSTKLVDDLRADDLDGVQVVLALEEEFDLKLSDADVMSLSTLDDVIQYVLSRKRSTR